MTQTGFRFEGDVAGCLKAFVAVHPAWAGDPHEITARAPGDEEATDRMSIDLVRACTRWAREHRYISADMATALEIICRRVDDFRHNTLQEEATEC